MKATPPAPDPTAPVPAADATATPGPEVPPAAPQPPAWPAWFATADAVIAALVLVAAFLAASFAARNSDAWLHLAAGKLVATGSYPFGSDPFSYTGAGRAWADPSWLYDLGLYAAYSANPTGGLAVALKAAAFAAAFGLVLLLRRPGQALWPWAVLAGLGVLAAAPQASLRPQTLSMLFLSLTLLLLYRGRWDARGWRTPGLLAGLFALWANCDAWFVLGPFTVLLVLVGEVLHRRLVGGEAAGGDAADPFRPAPPVPALVKALLIGTAACLLNPSTLAALAKDPAEAVAQLVPQELGRGLPPEAAEDPELVVLTISPLSSEFTERPSLGYNLNGAAAALLAAGGVLALALGYARVRATHVLLWVGFAAVALQQYRLIPYFAVVAVPVAAAYLNGLSAGLRTDLASPGNSILLTLSGVGRILTVTAALLMAAAGWPGWLHYQSADPAFQQRVEWKVEPDPGLTRAAARLQKWRDAGDLPADARGLVVSPDFGNICAWFAPGEKVFVNGRYRFHRAELADLIRVRRAVGLVRSRRDTPVDAAAVGAVCDARSAGYVTLAGGNRRADLSAVFGLLDEPQAWALWHLDGRAAVVGRAGAAGSGRLGFDPVRLAFGPVQEPLPEAKPTLPPAGDMPFLQQYVDRPAPLTPDADDAIVLAQYADITAALAARRWQAEIAGRGSARAAAAGIAAVVVSRPDPQPIDDAQLALPVLVVRAATRAAAATPDRPDPFLALISAYRSPFTPVADPDDRQTQLITAQARFLARLPDPAACPPPLALTGFQEGAQLAGEFERTRQYDFARQAFQRAAEYAAAVARRDPEMFRVLPGVPPDAKVDELAAAVLKDLDAKKESLTTQVARLNDRFQQAQARLSPAARFEAAANLGLPARAIQLFEEGKTEDFGRDALPVAMTMITLELRAGKLEQAAAHLSDLESTVADSTGKEVAGVDPAVKAQLRGLRGVVDRLAGNFKAAGEALTEAASAQLPKFNAEGLKVLTDALPLLAHDRPGLPLGLWTAAGGPAMLTYVDRTEPPKQIRQAILATAEFHFQRAVLALYEGNMAEAKARFEQAASPQGIDLARLGNPARAQARQYLRLIETAAK